jgi:hypothetical protein
MPLDHLPAKSGRSEVRKSGKEKIMGPFRSSALLRFLTSVFERVHGMKIANPDTGGYKPHVMPTIMNASNSQPAIPLPAGKGGGAS